jgi:REase_DpnII-MboI
VPGWADGQALDNPQFDRVDRENILPRFAAKTYRPDFGVPDLRTFVEVKYIGAKTDVGAIQGSRGVVEALRERLLATAFSRHDATLTTIDILRH